MATEPTRRTILRAAALAASGFVVGCGRPEDRAAVPRFNAFVRVGANDTVTVIVKHLEMGQGIATGLATLAAEELDADWSHMRYEFAPADALHYANLRWGDVQGTGCGTSLANSWIEMRQAAAAARAMLLTAAAQRWRVPVHELSIARGTISHASGARTRFGGLAVAAAEVTPPQSPTLKDTGAFRYIGTELPGIDNGAKSTGTELCSWTISHLPLIFR